MRNIDDENYVEWRVTLIEHSGLYEDMHRPIKIHKCTEEEYKEFNPIIEANKNVLQILRRDKIMYCLDKYDQFGNEIDKSIYGNHESGIFRTLSIEMKPCTPR